jgi:tetratricopeptide (TPR) repeat protein
MNRAFPFFLLVCLFLGQRGIPSYAQSLTTARAHAARGLELAHTGNLDQAAIELRRAVTLDPKNADYLADLATVLAMQRNLKEAEIYFEKALRLDPDSLALRRSLAADQFQLGEFNSARENLERILQAYPTDRSSILLLGMTAANLKNYAQAARLLASVPDLVAQHPESVAALARAYYRTGQAPRARETLATLLAHPHPPESVFLGGQMAEEAGDWQTAEKLFDSIRSVYPDPSQLAFHLAHVEYGAGRYAASRQLLDELLREGHENGRVYELLGLCRAKENQLALAQEALEKAIALAPSTDSYYTDLAMILWEHGRANTGLALMRDCVQQIPESFNCYLTKGRIERSQQYYKDAVASFTQAARLRPSSADAEFGLATSLAGLGEVRQAAAAFQKTIRISPGDARPYREYAKLLLAEAGANNALLRALAAEMLEKSISRDPSNEESHYLLGQIWLDQGKIQAALSLLQTAARLNPQDGKVHYALWRAYRNLGREEQATTELSLYKQLSLGKHQPHPSSPAE